MDDDDLLLNFSSTPAESQQTRPKAHQKVTGGKWKDRRKTQLMKEGRGRNIRKKSDPNGIAIKENRLETTTDSGKRKNPDQALKRSADSNTEALGSEPIKKARFSESRGEAGGKNNTYVSSLFTASAEIQQRKYENDNEIENLSAPSNAPLADSTTFDGLGVNDLLTKHLTEHLRFIKPTKIQRSVLPRLLTRERDLFVQAQTGSGKTLAFALPIFQKLTEVKDLNRTSGLFALILTPTRELATQIYSVLETLTRCCHRIVPGLVIGGEKKKSEKARMRKGVNILVATPGRLADHIDNTKTLDLSNIRYVVLDEGDRLMELGFEETITKILKEVSESSRVEATTRLYPTLPHRRINVLCSATIKPTVKKLGDISLEDAELVAAQTSTDTDDLSVPDQLVQQVLIVPPKLRLVTLSGILKNLNKSAANTKTIVFFSCSDSVDFHFIALTRSGKRVVTSSKKKTEDTEKVPLGPKHPDEQFTDSTITALTAPIIGENLNIYKLHGSLSQQVRTSTLKHFSENSDTNSILLCTDVASRGLDLPRINNVVEFDPPFAIEDHLHRVGRTARAGGKGFSVMLLLPGDEENYIKKIEPLHPNGIHFKKYESVLQEAFDKPGEKGGSWDTQATTFHLDIERWLLDEPRAKEIASNGFVSHIRAYATHLSAERECFNVKKIHLGHLAKSFGLRETPKKVANGSTNSVGKKKKEDPRNKMLRVAKRTLAAQSDEFNLS